MGFFDNDKIYVGYEISDKYAMISYAKSGSDNVETISSVIGTQAFNIPMVLAKRKGVNQWYFGNEALDYAKSGEGLLVENLLEKAKMGYQVVLEEKSFDSIALLTLFIRRSLSLLHDVAPIEKIEGIMFTARVFDNKLLEILSKITEKISLKDTKIFYQSHTESFYNYMIHQEECLWAYQSVLFDYEGENVNIYRMECNKKTTPIVAYIEEQEFAMSSFDSLPSDEFEKIRAMEELDREFLHLATSVCKERIISSVYLIGDDFSEEWMKESVKYLCFGRRVFVGNNLFSKGACYGIMERMSTSKNGRNHVFLGNDKLKSNIGMNLFYRGEEKYLPILDAGVNWFEATNEFQIYLSGGGDLEVIITSLIGQGSRIEAIDCSGFLNEALPDDMTRLNIKFYLENENQMVIEITDLGLGKLRKKEIKTVTTKIEV